MNKKELMARVDELGKAVSEKDQKIGTLTAQVEELTKQNTQLATSTQTQLDELEQKRQNEHAKANNAHQALQDYARDLEAQVEQLSTELEGTKNALTRERGQNRDNDKLKEYIARSVEPITREEIQGTYGNNYSTAETAANFMLVAISDSLQPTYALPKADFRQRRSSTGTVANLVTPMLYPALLNDLGFQSMLPQQLLTAPRLVFGKHLSNGVFQLRDPRSAENVVVFLSVNGATWLQWKVDNKDKYPTWERHLKPKNDPKMEDKKKKAKPEEDTYEVSIILPFPGEDDSLRLDPELDKDATEEDVVTLRKQRDDNLRQYCYRQYLNWYFNN